MVQYIIEMDPLSRSCRARSGRAEIFPGDRVLVSAKDGLDTAMVTGREQNRKKAEWKIIRKLKKEDYDILSKNRKAAAAKQKDVKREIEKEGLEMNLSCLRYTYDRSKLYIYYTAGHRVDFRTLIKNLGAKFKLRVHMVQIGVRDRAALLGGIGICGRETCCSSFLRNIETVNIDMARNQNMVQNTENISGCCGRLQCCLRFENKFYNGSKETLPAAGKKVSTPDGRGTVSGVDSANSRLKVKLKNGKEKEYDRKSVVSGVKERLKKWIK